MTKKTTRPRKGVRFPQGGDTSEAAPAAPLSRAELDAHSRASLEIETVPVPEWGGSVFVRRLRAADQLALEPLFTAFKVGKADAVAELSVELVTRSLCDASGARLYGDTPEDHAALGELDPDGFIRVLNAVKAKRQRKTKAAAKN